MIKCSFNLLGRKCDELGSLCICTGSLDLQVPTGTRISILEQSRGQGRMSCDYLATVIVVVIKPSHRLLGGLSHKEPGGYLGVTEALRGFEQAVGDLGDATGQCEARERSCSHPLEAIAAPQKVSNTWEVPRAQHKTATPHTQRAEYTVVYKAATLWKVPVRGQ